MKLYIQTNLIKIIILRKKNVLITKKTTLRKAGITTLPTETIIDLLVNQDPTQHQVEENKY